MNTQDRRFLWRYSADRCRYLVVCLSVGLSLGTLGSSAWLLAQSELATITGTVADATGGIIGNADVIVMNQGTNIASTGRTDENGRYVVRSLKPGLYTMTVSAPGFKKYVNNALTLQVNQTARLDIELTIGEVTQ
ncbi:MAG TPA: carboxypeptidase-like regulatory domain-containing protein, partial [Terriglobia bacterium]|nr:carboxypeptidase-like regulatory domain-containing protein [Terriglobia bacterium]